MKHIKELKLNEDNNIPDNKFNYGWGWIIDLDDRGIVEPHLIITKRNNRDDAVRIISSVFPGRPIVKVNPWNNIVHNCIIEKYNQ